MTENSVKKLAAIPWEMLNTLQSNLHQQQHPDYSNLMIKPELKYLNTLDNDLKSILFNNTLPPEIKFGKYVELLNQFNNLSSSIKKMPIEIKIKDETKTSAQNAQLDNLPQHIQGMSSDNVTSKSVSQTGDIREKIIQSLPQKHRNNGKQLLDAIESESGIEWNKNDNSIKINGKEIENSNMQTLLNDFMRRRKNTSVGFDELGELLLKQNFPEQFIGNKEAWNGLLWKRARSPRRNLFQNYNDNRTPFSATQERRSGSGFYPNYSSASTPYSSAHSNRYNGGSKSRTFHSANSRYSQQNW